MDLAPTVDRKVKALKKEMVVIERALETKKSGARHASVRAKKAKAAAAAVAK
jgi:hypothetical protein